MTDESTPIEPGTVVDNAITKLLGDPLSLFSVVDNDATPKKRRDTTCPIMPRAATGGELLIVVRPPGKAGLLPWSPLAEPAIFS